ncbi:hypothetical protein BpHYR1_014393 [Brachionus plicatilis]|uniref:CCHC-type domain-containing protein n=1 Tax=Brachionus plicatilis TaxID=10195 RepID=A0A3M7RAJ8_BRAPC|nr:hypothetical protein BpHYR1_014393 [Brachionus plicatilis]
MFYLTWVELKSHLLATYKPDDVQRTLRFELKATKLDVNYEENVLKFQQIANKIEKIDEFKLTLDDAITQARIFTRSTWSVNKSVPVYYSRNNYKKRLKSLYNLREKEVDREKNLNNKTDDRSKIPVCYRCKKPGHFKADCKVKLFSGENNNNQIMEGIRTKENEANPKKSYLAEETEETESINRNRDTEYVYVCSTGNLLRINGLVDADNAISMVVGKTEKIKLDIQGHVCFMEFLIIDHEDNDGLLGLDWFMQTGASLNPSQKLIKFPSDIILMNSDEDETDTLLTEEACSIKFADDFELSEDEWPLEKSKTKLFPYAEPIKSKSAEEKANILWKFICIFGPPRVSDQDESGQSMSLHPQTTQEPMAKQIKDLIDDKYPTALQNIDKAKFSQIKAQNNNRPVTETVISTGSKVWIRVMGLNEKLHPKYRGPFTVLGQTKNGNYIVEDVFKQKQSDTFPSQKIDASRC